MRSALLCVFFALIVHKESSLAADEAFRPTPIPLNEWNGGTREGSAEAATSEGAGKEGAGTLQDIIATDAPPAVTAVPAHYWEDALRHSVYLTLVRDKIDQLIAKGSVISPDGKPDRPHEVDDHDLWEKIKSAPFDRLPKEDPAILGDITIMSKGRLLEEKNGLRFTEDEMSKEKCKVENCTEEVKAYWSVKRVRQRDAETAPGKYHYELTFSVSSQTPKKQKMQYENPMRTFTVREGTPVEKSQYRIREPVHAPRPQRAIWFHKNIGSTPPRQRQKQEDGLDRLFTSWFSSEEELPPKRYKQVSYVPQMYPQHSKLGQAGAPADQYHQKQPSPYSYKPQPQTLYKHPRPPLGPPPSISHPYPPHQYLDFTPTRNHNQNQFIPPQTEYKYLPSNVVKTTKTTVLPTPPISYAPLNITMEVSYSNETEATTRDPEIITAFTMHSKPKPVPTKVSYFPEHVRPPVFNAPPGVFVTMDKKPFKPMPPLKYMHSVKTNKHRPVDFRPSPQVLDVQFSEPDPSEPFRPITMGYTGVNATDSSAHSSAPVSADVKLKPTRKSKPPKKHENTKQHRLSTTAPDIITAHNEVLEEMHWASMLGAFAKTSPMDAFKLNFSEFTTPLPFTTVSLTTTVQSTPSTTEAERFTSMTSKPKRTRPPPKFEKPMKAKKHKRVTSTTTTTTTTTTEKPQHRRPSPDLTPQASSTATKPGWQPHNKTENESLSTTPMTGSISNIIEASTSEASPTTAKVAVTTYRTATTSRPITTTTEALISTAETSSPVATSHLKNNRFRQSTVMLKGTSINHDKWSSPYLSEKNKTSLEKTKPTPTFGKYPRRKGSNFQGYVSTPKGVDEERKRQHVDHAYTKLNVISLSSTTDTSTIAMSTTTSKPTQATYEETSKPIDQDDTEDLNDTDDQENGEESAETEAEEMNDEHQTKDQEEFIFNTSVADSSKPGEKSNEVEAEIVTTTEETVVTSAHSAAKNKTKCKKKKNQSTNIVTQRSSETENEISVAPLESTTEKLSPVDFFDQIFGLSVDQNEADGNHTESKYVDNDEDLEEFLASINKKKDTIENDDEYEEDEKEETENSPFNNEEENRFARHADSYDDYQERPYSFLELMAME